MPYIRRHYSYFQMIGYEIPTGTATDPKPEYKASDGYEKKRAYLAVPENLFDDARIRLKRLAGIVDMAARHVDKRQNVLKVFMAPEFYLRPQKGGLSRSYSNKQFFDIIRALGGMFTHVDFIDWLFIPGTVVRDIGTNVHNQAIVIKGGQEDAPFIWTTKRHYSSSVDGIRNNLWPESNPRLKNLVYRPSNRLKTIMDIDNLRIGIEICRDHSIPFSALKKALRYKIEREDDRRLLDLHLLTANSQDLVEFSVAAYEGGYILREDGTSNKYRKPFSQIGLVTKQILDDINMVDYLFNSQRIPQSLNDFITQIPSTTRRKSFRSLTPPNVSIKWSAKQ